jgi:hypothetical protein
VRYILTVLLLLGSRFKWEVSYKFPILTPRVNHRDTLFTVEKVLDISSSGNRISVIQLGIHSLQLSNPCAERLS